MKVKLREIRGPWDAGWVLDKHTASSEYVGENAFGRPVFNTTRTEVGEATFLLKYRGDWDQVQPLAQAIADHICPKLDNIGFIVPMPASATRPRQPVTEVARSLGSIMKTPVFTNTLRKAYTGKSLKDLQTKFEKVEAIADSFSAHNEITNAADEGPWNVLVVDDLHHTGATMEAACKVLRTHSRIRNIYVAALTWR
jgi:predicted amidophosphoribosyltransferase